ncbi:TlpA disulfide reductase family protein [Postechiella marina]
MRILLVFFSVLLVVSCKKKNDTKDLEIKKEVVKTVKSNVDLDIYNFERFKPILNKQDNKVYVVNFWATWCAPCIKELPYFEMIKAKYTNVEVILVSLDFPHAYESKLKPFIAKHTLKSQVIALDNEGASTWMSKVNKNWSGSIPATIIYKNENSKFYEKSFNFMELEKEVKAFLN